MPYTMCLDYRRAVQTSGISFVVTVAMMLLFLVLTGQTDLLRILNRR